MKVSLEQLGGQLKKSLAPVYLVSGDEPLQHMEATDIIRQASKAAGYTHRELFYVETGFDWGGFEEACNSFSLFGEQRILDVRLPSKPDKKGSTALLRYGERPPSETILIVSLPKLTASDQKKEKWFQSLEKNGVFIQVWPLEGEKLLHWLDRRLNAKGILADSSGLRLLAGRIEGNLLAATQEIEKLYLLYGRGKLSDKHILDAVAYHARYDVFGLAEEVLRGHVQRACRILNGLRMEGVAAPLVLWALTRELRLVNILRAELESGVRPDTVFSKHKIWESRKSVFDSALNRLDQEAVRQAILLSAQADRVMKGQERGDEWEILLSLCAYLSVEKGKRNSLPIIQHSS